MAATSPHSNIPENHHIDFRAPPPSPIASGRRSSFVNDDVLTEFLQQSLRIPDLILPDRIFPKQQILETPPVIDFKSLVNGNSTLLGGDLDSAARLGCFQLVNHGIPFESVRSAVDLGQEIFNVPLQKRAMVTKSSEKSYGFEEENVNVEGDAQEEEEESGITLSEEFVWCRDESLKLGMERILPYSYSNFSVKMEALMSNIETVGGKLLQVVKQYIEEEEEEEEKLVGRRDDMVMQGADRQEQGRVPELSACYLRKHRRNVPAERWERSLRYDVIKMLIRGTDHSHALCFHICDGGSSSEFHVYSKKGWISFSPQKDATVVTIGDQLQAMSDGKFKHVLGRPIVKSGEDDPVNISNCISMAFLYSPPPPATNRHVDDASNSSNQTEVGNTISITQQAIVALVFTIFYQFFTFLYNKF